MKTTFALCLALFALSSAEAQSSRSQPVNGSVPGRREQVNARGHAGGSQGGDYVRRSSPGAYSGNSQGRVYHHSGHQGHSGHFRSHHGHNYWHGGIGYYGGGIGYGYPSYGYASYGYPSYGYYGGYGSGYPYYNGYGYYGSTSAATNGLLLGALAGGIIGHNSGDLRHSAWRGSAWGAGAGWLLGSIFDGTRRSAEYAPAPVVVQQAPVVQSQAQPAAPAQPQQVTIINNYYNSSTPMGAANGMFGR